MYKKIITFTVVLLCSIKLVYGPEYSSTEDWMYNSDVATFSGGNDNISVTIEFKSGDTISSASMNQNFKKIEELLTKIINNNNLVVDLNRLVIFGTKEMYNGNLGGREGANEKCQQTSVTNEIKNNFNCNTVKALLSTSDLNFKDMFSDLNSIVSKTNRLSATSWQRFINGEMEPDHNPSSMGPDMASFWSGSDEDGTTALACSDWNSTAGNATYGWVGGNSSGWLNSGVKSCADENVILCSCSN